MRGLEEVTGTGTVGGAQRLGRLWRIYLKSAEHRNTLLVEGITVRGTSVTILDRNNSWLSGGNNRKRTVVLFQ